MGPSTLKHSQYGGGPIFQGEILHNISRIFIPSELINNEEDWEVDEENIPYGIVASQDCDLEQDFNKRFNTGAGGQSSHGDLPNILLYHVHFLADIRSDQSINGSILRQIKNNNHKRYHTLSIIPREFINFEDLRQDMLDSDGNLALIIDFKRYFTIPTEEMYARLQNNYTYRTFRLASPFLEDFSIRAAQYQCRIALPENLQCLPIAPP